MYINNIVRKEYYDGSLIQNPDDLISNIPKIQSLFRNSKLYKNYISSIKEGLKIKNCAFFKEKNFDEVDLELHHIFSLYDVVFVVGMKRLETLNRGEFLTVFDIVNSVVEFHMKDFPVVMMLSTTLHQLHHTGQYSLPQNSKEFHSGNYTAFIQEYKDFLNKEKIINLYKYFNIDVEPLFK